MSSAYFDTRHRKHTKCFSFEQHQKEYRMKKVIEKFCVAIISQSCKEMFFVKYIIKKIILYIMGKKSYIYILTDYERNQRPENYSFRTEN